MSLPRYPQYKPSGVEWLGEIPAHWKLVRLRRCSTLNPSKSEAIASGFEAVTFLPMDAIGTDGSLDLGTVRPITELLSGYTYFADDDVVVAKITPCFENGKHALMQGLENGMGFGTTELIVLRADKSLLSPRFLQALVTSTAFRLAGEAEMYGAGGQKRVPDEFVRNFFAPIPPPPEQRAIATFLDQETAKIDVLVQAQELLIDLLKEKRQALITHAVTKGILPNAPMKPSGIVWLGDVPAHWRLGAIKYFVLPKSGAIKTGPFGSHLTAADMASGTIKVYNQRSVIDSDFNAGENFISEAKFAELSSFEIFPGDLLITTRGTIGRAAILPESAQRGILHPCLLRLQPDNSLIDTKFLKSLIQDSDLMKAQLSYLSNATTIEVIYSHTIASVIVPVPPIAEQHSIMGFLAVETARLDELTAEAHKAIALLKERRAALITAAVTGQIDVRGAVAQEAA